LIHQLKVRSTPACDEVEDRGEHPAAGVFLGAATASTSVPGGREQRSITAHCASLIDEVG
jgi:hypothetical protein